MRILLIGDAGVETGFARMNHAYADGLIEAGHEVHILALNYLGDPHDYPYVLYPTRAWGQAMYDWSGIQRMPELIRKIRPDVISVTNDPWNIEPYVERAGNTPVIASVAVDGKNCRGRQMNGLKHATFWTKFGETEAKIGGYKGASSVIPLGVDLENYGPMDRTEAREKLGLPPHLSDAFIVGVVGRNQPRKRIDLAMIYFAKWIREHDVKDAYLYLHVAPTGDEGYDLLNLGHYLGISNRMIVAEPHIGHGVPQEFVRYTYCAFNLMLTTTQGEGWGLCNMEAMACGVPNIVPDWAALAEWPEDAAWKVPCSSIACTPNNINVIGGVPDEDETVDALNQLYGSDQLREELTERGLVLVSRPQYRWSDIGRRYAEAVESVLTPVKVEAFS